MEWKLLGFSKEWFSYKNDYSSTQIDEELEIRHDCLRSSTLSNGVRVSLKCKEICKMYTNYNVPLIKTWILKTQQQCH